MSWDCLSAEVASMFGDHSAWQQREFDWQFAAERIRETKREASRALMARLYARRSANRTCTKCDLPPEPGHTRCTAHREMNRIACRNAYRRARASIAASRYRCGACGVAGHNTRTCAAQQRSAA